MESWLLHQAEQQAAPSSKLEQAQAPLRIAIVDEELPYPATSGKRIRTLNLLLRLARRHHLSYLCHRNADVNEARTAAAFLNEHGIETVVVERAVPPKSGVGFYLRLTANLGSSLPYSVATHISRELRQAILEHAARQPVDLWHCEWTPYAENLRGIAEGRHVIMAHNIESLIWQRYYELEPNWIKRWYIKQQWRKFQRFERRVFEEARQLIAVSQADADLARTHFGARRVALVDNGVDTRFFVPTAGKRDPKAILFLGSLDWRPNQDAVRVLLESIFPFVRAAEPLAQLMIVGRMPPSWLHDLIGRVAGAELHADVADVRPYLAQCGQMAVPLRIGGGSRLKILEALAAAVPVVSTRVGAEGLILEPGRHLTVVDEPDEMAEALLACIRAPAAAQAMAWRGREVVLAQYDWDVLADRLEQIWLACLEQ